jgi:hypothetical protein
MKDAHTFSHDPEFTVTEQDCDGRITVARLDSADLRYLLRLAEREDATVHRAKGWGIEYANGDCEWYDDAQLRDNAYERDERLAFRHADEFPAPVARLKREVVTTLAITRDEAP